jgi:Sulfotransferase domain
MRCTLCPPEKYGESSYSFRRRCLTTKRIEVQNDGSTKRNFSEYKPDRLAKAIHLIRDPFDNIVSRYHLERQFPGRTAKNFDKSREGFRAYCASVENLHDLSEKKFSFLDADILQLMSAVPCHEDFLRYVEWHNLAFMTAADLELETYVMHYEWFTTRYNATTMELLDFLELQQRAEPTPFLPGRSYNYYTIDERAAVKDAFELMASPQTWSHLAHYFDNNIENVAAVQ